MEKEQFMSKTLKASICYMFALLAFVIIRIISSYGVFKSFYGFTGDLIVTLIMQLTCLVLLPLCIYRLFSSEDTSVMLSDFGYRKISKKTFMYCIILGIIAFIINVGVSSVWNIFLYLAGYSSRGSGSSLQYKSIIDLIVSLISTAFLPAMCEEFLHRGLFQSMVAKEKGFISAILTGILFGLYHLNIYQTGYAAVLGIVMGLIAYYSKSIWPAVIMHFMNNAINVFLSYFSSIFPKIDTMFENIFALLTGNSTMLLISTIILGIIYMLLIYWGFIIFTKVLKEEIFKTSDISSTDIAGAIINTDYSVLKIKDENIKNRLLDAKIALKETYKTEKTRLEFKDYIVLITVIFLSLLITIFTFIWGIM